MRESPYLGIVVGASCFLAISPLAAQLSPRDERCSKLTFAIMNRNSDQTALMTVSAAEIKHCDNLNLRFASSYANANAVSLLLNQGADPNEEGEDHITPLMRAADGQDIGDRRSDREASLGVVRQLIAAKADINFAIPSGVLKGKRAIHFALGKGDVAMVKVLLDFGANLRMADPNPDPVSPLEWAIQSEDSRMVSYVLSLGPARAGDISSARIFFDEQRRAAEQRNIFPRDEYVEIDRLLSRADK